MPLDSTSPTVKALPGDRVKIVLERRKPAARRVAESIYLHVSPRPSKFRHAAEFAFYDIGTFYSVTSDNVSGYRETGTEIPVTPTAGELAGIRNEFTANLQTATVGGSNRLIENCYRLQSDSAETDGLITALVLGIGETTRRYDLIAASTEWAQQVPAADRIAALDTLPSGASDQAVASARAAIVAESLESWDAYSASRTSADGTITARDLDGRYTVAIESVRSFYSFDTADLVNYKITDEPAYERPEAPVMAVEVGDTQSTRVDVFLVPQMVQTTVQWIARYLFISLFGWGYFTYPNTGSYMSRLPFYPLAYNLNLAGTATQSVTMSERIKRTTTYARMLASDLVRQVFTPYYAILLEARYDGRWTIYQRDIAEGQLVGILRFRYQGGPPIVRYVWRRTPLVRPFVALDAGSLNVPGEVVGAIGL